jgi:hypothetical protein
MLHRIFVFFISAKVEECFFFANHNKLLIKYEYVLPEPI